MHFPLKKPEVKDIYRLFGEYGFFLVVQADGQNGLAQILREIDGGQKVIKTAPVLFTIDTNSEMVRDPKSTSALA